MPQIPKAGMIHLAFEHAIWRAICNLLERVEVVMMGVTVLLCLWRSDRVRCSARLCESASARERTICCPIPKVVVKSSKRCEDMEVKGIRERDNGRPVRMEELESEGPSQRANLSLIFLFWKFQ